MEDYTERLAQALKALAEAQAAASLLWDEMEAQLSVEELDRALDVCGEGRREWASKE